MIPPEIRRLRLLEEENRRLKQMAAAPTSDKQMLQDLLSSEL
jgi:putative transposase